MRRNLFFDLDGTLINAHQRLYQLFSDLIPLQPLSFDEYWNFKKCKVSNETLLTQYLVNKSDKIERFHDEWMKKIEEPEYLDMDEPFSGVEELLDKLHEQNNLYIISHRQSDKSAIYQLDKWGLKKYFSKIFITNQKITKAGLIKQELGNLGQNDVLVGDTGEDIVTAKQIKVISVAVLSGFLNLESLSKYQPDYIFNSVVDIDFDKLGIAGSNK